MSAIFEEDNCSLITCRHKQRASHYTDVIKAHLIITNTKEKKTKRKISLETQKVQ